MSERFIMLVDDEVPFVETMTKRLEKRNLTVITAYEGQEALEKLERHRNLDVVILDVKMPGMDGIEVLKAIKKKNFLTEVIMLTGHGTMESAMEGMRLGAYDYLMKPCDIEQLLAKIEEATNRKRDSEEEKRGMPR